MLRTFAVVLAVAGMLVAHDGWAQDYPARPVKIIVPFAVGGPADIYARYSALAWQESMGQPFVIENRPGAGAVTGTDAAAKSPADGYTLLLMSNAHTVNETLIPNKPYALLRDFVPIAPINYSDLMLVVNPVGEGQYAAGVHRARQGGARQAQLRLVGPRHAVSHGRRAVQVDGRRRHRARSVQGELGRAHGRAGRPGRDDVRRRDDDERAGEGRQGARARDQRQDAIGGDAERADGRRSPACPATSRSSGSA